MRNALARRGYFYHEQGPLGIIEAWAMCIWLVYDFKVAFSMT